MSLDWHPQAYQWLINKNYSQVAAFYEQAIRSDPEISSNYGYLGLAYLYLKQESEAHAVWLTPSIEATDIQFEQWTQELLQILVREALRHGVNGNDEDAWLIRYHIYELLPNDLDNYLILISYSIKLGYFTESLLDNYSELDAKLKQDFHPFDIGLLLEISEYLITLETYNSNITAFVQFCLEVISQERNIISLITHWVAQVSTQIDQVPIAIIVAEQYAEKFPNDLSLIFALANFFSLAEDHAKAIKYSLEYEAVCHFPYQKVLGSYLVVRARMGYGNFDQDLQQKVIAHRELLNTFISNPPLDVDRETALMIATATYFFPYLEDTPGRYRHLQNQIGQWCCQFWPIQPSISENARLIRERSTLLHYSPSGLQRDQIRIGYLSHSLRQHSVGWLSRWLFRYHDREKFHISLFLTSDSSSLFTQSWFVQQVDIAHDLKGASVETICDRIHDDHLDILIDLDSLTSDLNLGVLAAKPAPIQMTWLGWDAPGLPTVDYFIADPHVLPAHAENIYCETILRLPETYIAVDGFEIGVPTLRREDLGIPANAVVYFSGQRGYKRHPEMMKLQMKIIKEVANSYLMIKGVADQASTQAYFRELAENEGVNPQQLCFLPQVGRELEHRANLQLADVVLDTYPYNGATTTLETLWLGIPIVTLVGEQFASRNSYAFMKNTGVEEGIAWNPAQYLSWGITLGESSCLRMSIMQKLHASRHTSPLWNTRKFVTELENTYHTIRFNYD